MKFHKDLKVYGDTSFRGKCPKEELEQITFFNQLKKLHPDIAELATHVQNEGVKSYGKAAKDARCGLNQGMADIIIIGHPACLIEMKRQDHTKSTWQPNQLEKLLLAQDLGVFTCVALGYEAALEAVKDWIKCTKAMKTGLKIK